MYCSQSTADRVNCIQGPSPPTPDPSCLMLLLRVYTPYKIYYCLAACQSSYICIVNLLWTFASKLDLTQIPKSTCIPQGSVTPFIKSTHRMPTPRRTKTKGPPQGASPSPSISLPCPNQDKKQKSTLQKFPFPSLPFPFAAQPPKRKRPCLRSARHPKQISVGREEADFPPEEH